MSEPDDLLSVAEAAELLDLHAITVRRLVHTQGLPVHRHGKAFRLRRSDLEK